MAKKSLKNVEEIVGFGAVQKYGSKLETEEINSILDYSENKGGDRKYIVSILKNGGRPFSISDPTFKRKCGICNALENYCCC